MAALSHIRGKRGQYLLELALQGRTYRYTSGPDAVAVTTAAGQTHRYVPGFADPRIPQAAGATRAGITLELINRERDSWALLYARGVRFELATGIVRRWYPGQVLEQAEVVLRGVVSEPEYGDADEPLVCRLEPRYREGGVIPLPSMRVSAETWPVDTNYSVDPEILGVDYPIIIGRPGYVPGVTSPTTPALLVEWSKGTLLWSASKLLLAGHEVQASTCTVYDLSAKVYWTATISHTTDLLGRKVAYTTAANVTPVTSMETGFLVYDYRFDRGHEYRVAWDGDGGGIHNRTRSAALRGAGEVLRYMIEEWAPNLTIDTGRQEAQRSILDAYKVDLAVTEQAQAWDVVRDHLLPILPVEWVETSDGGYFQAWRFDANRTRSAGHLDATPRGYTIRGWSRTWGFEDGSIRGFGTGGDAAWYATNATSAVGSWSARSGDIADSEETYLDLTPPTIPEGGATFTVQRKVDSEGGFDFLRVYVNGASVATYDGSVAWGEVGPFSLVAGANLIRFQYDKDGSVSTGDDSGWIDALTVTVPDRLARGGNCVRVSSVRSTGEIRNRIKLNYAKGGQDQRYLKTIIVDAERNASDARVRPDLRCWISQTLYGVRDLEISTDVIYEDATAGAIATQLAIRYALPRRTVDVEGGAELDRYELGDVITFTDHTVEIEDAVAIVRGKVVTDSAVGLTLMLVDDPLNMARVLR